MKKFIPAIALMFVVALSSFSTISSSAKATDDKGKKFSTVYFKYLGPTLGWDVTDEDFSCPSVAGTICKIEYDNSITEANAKQGALNNLNTSATAPYTVQAVGGGNVLVYPRAN